MKLFILTELYVLNKIFWCINNNKKNTLKIFLCILFVKLIKIYAQNNINNHVEVINKKIT